jgi:hypothetical protein
MQAAESPLQVLSETAYEADFREPERTVGGGADRVI